MWILVAWLLFASLAGAAQTAKSIYIDSFGDKPGASDLRRQVTSELRKSPMFHVVETARDADLLLVGTGEVWVKGYYSLNPRNRSISDAQALFTGYLSVELKDKEGETIWSYLATPHSSGSKDVSRILARLVVRKLTGEVAGPLSPRSSDAVRMTTLTGAGATFPYPLYEKWFAAFHKENPEIEMNYDPVGSEAGMRRLMDGATDFAGSDVMIGADEYFAGGKPKFLRFPAIQGAVVPVYNLSEDSGHAIPLELRFTPDVLADIYLGRILKWNDPRIRAVNRDAMLPDREIAVIHRADGSGTSYVWSDYLSKVSPAWKSAVGVSSTPKWPVGQGAEGNEGVAKLVRETSGSIGYVEYIYAIANRMAYASVRNSAGKFTSPDLESILATTLGSSSRLAEDFQTSITNAPGTDAYPISAFTWFVVPAEVADPDKKRALKQFLQWMLGAGERQAAALGYVSIAPEILLREQQMLDRY